MKLNALSLGILGIFVFPLHPASAAPPQGLHGKSILVTWTEARLKRHVGEPNFYNVSARHDLRIYISATGRVFSRLTNTTGAGSGNTEQVAGGGASPIPARVPAFGPEGMTLFMPFKSGGMRRLLATFDASFSSCNARVANAKQQGAATQIAHSPITKKDVEFSSVTPAAASCTVSAGNVFGH